MNEFLLFKILELSVALGILYSTYRISESTNSGAWEKISLVAVVLSVKSVAEIILFAQGFTLASIEGVFMPSMALLLSGAGLSFMDSYGDLGRFKALGFLGTTAAVVTAVFAASFYVPIPMVYSVYYMATPVLLIPAVYSFYLMQERGERAVFMSMLAGTGFIFIGSMMNIYLASVCKCSPIYGFSLPIGLTSSKILEATAVSAPVLQMTGILFLGFAVYLFHHGVFRDVSLNSQESDTSKELVSETIQNLGAIVGEPVVKRMTLKALNNDMEKNAEDPEKAAEGENLEEVKETLKESLGKTIGPVAERKIDEIYEEEKGEQ
ncbi:MAG: hypothetical protein BRC30_02520 [Nanohaloarchaea archaeon SW_7_46_7]|nr:MAG: hypothetical protein BRC30_02520 [Nanohaloarchaea archaeon SW_7_46_7]